jgi:AcrR family transcriptional regulator
VAQKISTTGSSSSSDVAPARSRRRRGEARLALLDTAREVFNERGYSDTSTREIADRAAVSETLMFRYFGSKAGLFREAMVQPFVQFVDQFIEVGDGPPAAEDDEITTRRLVEGLYDLFHEHRALVAMFFAADTQLESDLTTSGVLDEVAAQLKALVDLGRQSMRVRHGKNLPRHDLTTRVTLAMVAGMATFGPSFYSGRRPSRKAIVDELTQGILHGHLHRSPGRR